MAFEASTKADPHYKHSDQLSGIDPYYGAHVVDSSTNVIADEFFFVKGNDLFFVAIASQADDVLSLTVSQAKAQYDSAPPTTIPTSDWPENNGHSSLPDPGTASANIFFAVLVLGVIGFVVVRIIRGRKPPAAVAFQMSEDRNYWWDGQIWRDTSQQAPPNAHRSNDEALWWDGRNWRPNPQVPGPEQRQPPSTDPHGQA